MQYPKLMEAKEIRRVRIKNRGVMTAMGVGLCNADGTVNERIRCFYEERARGGIGMIITEFGVVDSLHGRTHAQQLRFDDTMYVNGLERLTDSLHPYDTVVLAQLYHGGNVCNEKLTGQRNISASEIPAYPGASVPRALSTEEVGELVGKYAFAASVAQAAGFDGVEIHAAHGYLLAQFLSPHYNKREDQYGGSFENRIRLLDEIVHAVRERCGRGFLISVRYSGDEMAGAFGDDYLTAEDGIAIAEHIEERGEADLLNISMGNTLTSQTNCEPYFYKQGWKKHVAKAIREAVSLPVIATNTIKTPEEAEAMLEEGVCDFVGMARSQLADPAFMKKAEEGRADEIDNCIGCMYCRESMGGLCASIRCTVNPRLSKEDIYRSVPKDGNGRKIAVLGGGPGGMKAAAVLAQRGFAVTLFEKGDSLGGTLRLAEKPEGKEKLRRLREKLAGDMERAGVQVRTGCVPAPEMLAEEGFEAAFLAWGAKPVIPPIPGTDGANVITAEEILRTERKPEGRILIVGSGMTGLECAEFLADGSRQVQIIEMQHEAAPGMYFMLRSHTLKLLTEKNVMVYTDTRLCEITTEGVLAKDLAEDRDVRFEADTVVLALGVAPDPRAAEEYRKALPKVVVIGDAVRGGKIVHAIKDGFTKAMAY